jgi:membrane protein YqaA with SNARE-associated domain
MATHAEKKFKKPQFRQLRLFRKFQKGHLIEEAMLGDQIISFFDSFGAAGMLAALFVIFLTDSMLFPTVPEFFLLVAYATNHSFGWAATIVATAVASVVAGNTILYLFVKTIGLPKFIRKAMRTYSDIMVAQDERMLLVNRVAPALPFTGAFIAVNRWSYRKSVAYIILGGVAKFSVLVALSGFFYERFEEGTAQQATFLLVLGSIALGLTLAYARKRKLQERRVRQEANLENNVEQAGQKNEFDT